MTPSSKRCSEPTVGSCAGPVFVETAARSGSLPDLARHRSSPRSGLRSRSSRSTRPSSSMPRNLRHSATCAAWMPYISRRLSCSRVTMSCSPHGAHVCTRPPTPKGSRCFPTHWTDRSRRAGLRPTRRLTVSEFGDDELIWGHRRSRPISPSLIVRAPVDPRRHSRCHRPPAHGLPDRHRRHPRRPPCPPPRPRFRRHRRVQRPAPGLTGPRPPDG